MLLSDFIRSSAALLCIGLILVLSAQIKAWAHQAISGGQSHV